MEPGLHDGVRILVNRLAYIGASHPKRGDVVVFHPWSRTTTALAASLDDSADYVKRVIGIPGDTLEVRDGFIFVNGLPIDEPYTTGPTPGRVEVVSLGPDEYFVLGDNRAHSSDSRLFGVVRGGEIVGRAWMCYWPPAAIGRLSPVAVVKHDSSL